MRLLLGRVRGGGVESETHTGVLGQPGGGWEWADGQKNVV